MPEKLEKMDPIFGLVVGSDHFLMEISMKRKSEADCPDDYEARKKRGKLQNVIVHIRVS